MEPQISTSTITSTLLSATNTVLPPNMSAPLFLSPLPEEEEEEEEEEEGGLLKRRSAQLAWYI